MLLLTLTLTLAGLSGPQYYRSVHAMAPATDAGALDLETGRNTLTVSAILLRFLPSVSFFAD